MSLKQETLDKIESDISATDNAMMDFRIELARMYVMLSAEKRAQEQSKQVPYGLSSSAALLPSQSETLLAQRLAEYDDKLRKVENIVNAMSSLGYSGTCVKELYALFGVEKRQ